MSFVGNMFKLFAYDLGPLGPVLLILLALGSMWMGYRFSRPFTDQLSVRRHPSEPLHTNEDQDSD